MGSGAKYHQSGVKYHFHYGLRRRIRGCSHMFMGEFDHTIDSKGRIIIPSKFREDLGEVFYITAGLDGCLYVYPLKEWQALAEKFTKLPGNEEARRLQRFFFSKATECEVDKQGRILIPVKLREDAGLDKDIVFVGVLNKIEIWSKERLENNNNYDNVNAIAEHMSQYGISF